MDYNFSNTFGFPWNTSGPYVVPGFNSNSNPNVFANNGQSLPNISPYSHSNPGFGNHLMFPGARFPAGGIPFMNNGLFGHQSGNTTPQNTPFSGIWNGNFQTPVNNFNPMAGNHVNSGNEVKPEQASKIDAPKSAEQQVNGDNDITEKIVEKVSSMLAGKKIIQNAMSKIRGNSVHLSSADVTEDTEHSSNDNDDNDDDSCNEQPTISESVIGDAGKPLSPTNVTPLKRSSSNSSTESFTSPLKVVEKDRTTGEYIVRISSEEFDRIASNQNVLAGPTAPTVSSRKRNKTPQQLERAREAQNQYYQKNRNNPEFQQKNREKTRKCRKRAQEANVTFNSSMESTQSEQRSKASRSNLEQNGETEQDLNESFERTHSSGMSVEDKVREQNRIRQLAFKVREKLPKDYKSFVLVVAHLVKNAHRYYKKEEDCEGSGVNLDDYIGDKSCTFDFDQKKGSDNNNQCKDLNRILREISTLKHQNRIKEQQEKVLKLKESVGSYRTISHLSGIPLKTVHLWCSEPKERRHKGTEKSRLRQNEVLNFLMQDTVSYSHPCKKYTGKRFLIGNLDDTYKKYLAQPQYHTHGIISKTTMRLYKPKCIQLCGKIPLNQCLCDYCENCDLMMKALVAAGIKGLPSNRYSVVEASLCGIKSGQFGTDYMFCQHTCITRNCNDCGKRKLKDLIDVLNSDLLQMNNPVSWHKWQVVEGKSVPQKCHFKKPIRTAVNEFLQLVEDLSQHLFRANWHKNVFQYIKGNLIMGYLLQVMDFAMNFNNWYQDEVQSAYWNGTQTTIHGTINFFLCPQDGCNEIVTLALVHITDDLKHDSFLSRAAQNLTFKYLARMGIPPDLIIQFCDNCASQYKSRRPFVELSRSALQIIRVYFGEKHGKSHADALFGRLKAWMSYKIRARHFVVSDAHDFYRYCKEYYETPRLNNCCQHYRVEFEYIRPSDVRRHQDCDLDSHVEKTQDLYSVRNTPQPLELKVRNVPCLCPPCISEEGECFNAQYCDPWRTVKLLPSRGSSRKKYEKRKRPDIELPPIVEMPDEEAQQHIDLDESDDDLPDIRLEYDLRTKKSSNSKSNNNQANSRSKNSKEKQNNKQKNPEPVTDHVTDNVTDGVTDGRGAMAACTWINDTERIRVNEVNPKEHEESEDNKQIEICERASVEFLMASSNTVPMTLNSPTVVEDLFNNEMPEMVFWYSVLSALENCSDDAAELKLATELKARLPPLRKRIQAFFSRNSDQIDRVAQEEIPVDGPSELIAVWIEGDGNCLPRALSRAFFNDDRFHPEIRARIVIEGIINRAKYLSDDCLERGASVIHRNADLPTVFATFSECFTPGQRLTAESVSAIYSMETHSCACMNSYMGLWQLAQASSALGVPIHTIYPHRGRSIRNDFHRIFFPVEYPTNADDEPLVIMWTGMTRGAVPIHFVPLLRNPEVNGKCGRKRKHAVTSASAASEHLSLDDSCGVSPAKVRKNSNGIKKTMCTDDEDYEPDPTPQRKRERPRKNKDRQASTQKEPKVQQTSTGRIIKVPEKYQVDSNPNYGTKIFTEPSPLPAFDPEKPKNDNNTELSRVLAESADDVSLGLTHSDVAYLNKHSTEFNMNYGTTGKDLLPANIVQFTSEQQLIQDGEILNQLRLTDIPSFDLAKNSDENHFVQVSGESALGLVTLQKDSDNPQNFAMVSIPVSSTESNTITTNMVPISNIGLMQNNAATQVSDTVQIVTLPVANLHDLQNNIVNVGIDEGLAPATENVQSQIQVMTGATEPDVYILSLKMQDEDQVKIAVEEEKITPDKLMYGQPQCTSTPTHGVPVKPSLNETIIAGNIDAICSGVKQAVSSEEKKLSDKKSHPDDGQENAGKEDGGKDDGGKNDGGKDDGGKNDGGKNDGGKDDGGKEDVSPVVQAPMQTKTQQNQKELTAERKTKRCLHYPAENANLQIDMAQFNRKDPDETEEMVHNETYCQKWVEKAKIATECGDITKGNITIKSAAKSDVKTIEDDSLMDVTSITRNVPQYKGNCRNKNQKETACKEMHKNVGKKEDSNIVGTFYSRSRGYLMMEKGRELQKKREKDSNK